MLDNLRRLTGDVAEWKRMGEAAAESIRERFDRERGIENLEAIYREAMDLGRLDSAN